MSDLFDSLVTLDNVGLRYGSNKETLSNINLSVMQGDFFFLIGASGAGKSSLLKLIDMSAKPTRGFVNIFGKEVNNLGAREICIMRRKIGIVFQDYKLINEISVFNNVALPLKISKADSAQIEQQVNAMLGWVGLLDYKYEFPLKLSGGQQQLVAIARAVISNPKIILADEPTGSVDGAVANRIMQLFEQLNRQGTAILLATHNLDLVKKNNKKVFSIKDGNLTAATNSKIKI